MRRSRARASRRRCGLCCDRSCGEADFYLSAEGTFHLLAEGAEGAVFLWANAQFRKLYRSVDDEFTSATLVAQRGGAEFGGDAGVLRQSVEVGGRGQLE